MAPKNRGRAIEVNPIESIQDIPDVLVHVLKFLAAPELLDDAEKVVEIDRIVHDVNSLDANDKALARAELLSVLSFFGVEADD